MAKKDPEQTGGEGAEGFVLKAPIVVDTKTEQGVKPLLDFVAGLRTHRNMVIAAAENDRLRPYFRALSLYLRAQLTGNKKDTKYRQTRKLSGPRALSGLFNAMAAYSRNTLTSEMAIAPDSLMDEQGPASHLFGAQHQFQVEYKHGQFRFHVGFFQVRADTRHTLEESSTTFPLFLMDKRIAQRLEGHAPGALLEDFQAAFTLVNHDMLHHFTSPIINSAVAGKYGASSSLLDKWSASLPRSFHRTEAYEDWAQVSHEQVLIETPGSEKTARIADVERRVDRFFDELTRIGQEIAKKDFPGGEERNRIADMTARVQAMWRGYPPDHPSVQLALKNSGVPEKEHHKKIAHETVDYMGMAMAHALSRVFPLDHPVMQRCLDRLQAADPAPERILREMIEPNLRMKWDGVERKRDEDYPANPKDQADFIRSRFLTETIQQEILLRYQEAGLSILSPQDPEISYRDLKVLQLIKTAPQEVLRHAPREALGPMREKAGGAMVEMVQIAAKTIGFTPSAGKKPH